MATPDPILPDLAAEVARLRRRVDYLDQRSQEARPLRIDFNQDADVGSALTTTATVKKTVSGVCPVGFNACHVVTWVSAQAVNSRASGDYLYVMANINGWDAGSLYQWVPAGVGGSAVTAPHLTVTGLTPGFSLDVQVKAWTNSGPWSANAANQFGVAASYYWYR